MARVRNIGLPVNDSERKGSAFLSRELPDKHVLLTNLELPTKNGFARKAASAWLILIAHTWAGRP